MNKYNRTVLNGGNQYYIEGVRTISGKTFMFWVLKTTKSINEVFVIFDKKYENTQVNDKMAILSLKGLTNYNDLSEAISIFREITQYKQFKFQFIIGNENERILAEALGKNLGLIYTVKDMNEIVQKDTDQQRIMIEELKKQKELYNNKIIEKYDNGTLKQITINNNVAYENNGLLNIEEEKNSLLEEWSKDSNRFEELSKVSASERNELLNNDVLYNKKGYRMESARDQVTNNKKEQIATDKAKVEDGLVNTQLGIIQNNVSNPNKYSAVEESGDRVQIVNPKIVDINNYSKNNFNNSERTNEVSNNTYKYNGYNDTNISYDTEYASDYKEMNQNSANVYMKPKVRTLKPNSNKRAAFVSLPVIIFILSALLLIVSAVLLFVID